MKEVLENIGLSMAAYREGYVALAEDIISNGRQIDVSLNAKDAYFVYRLDGGISLWGCYGGDEVLCVLASCDTPFKSFSNISQIMPFESSRARGAAAVEIVDPKNPELVLKLHAEVVNYLLAAKNAGRFPTARPSAVSINGFILGDTLCVHADGEKYAAAHGRKPGASENSIVCLKSVNRDETPAEMVPFAHVTAGIEGFRESVNPYSRERFISIDASCRGFRLSFFTGYSRAASEMLEGAGKGAIIEADAYFTVML